jgi:chromosome segregation ATPase
MTTVTLEFLAAQMDRLLGAVAALEAKWARLEMRLDEVATRFGTVGTSLESLEGRLAAVQTRIGAVETGIGALETRLEKLEGRSDETSTRLEELAGRLGAVETGIGALETRIGAVETRLERLEEEQRSLRASHEALDQRVREMTADGKLTLAFLARQAERILDEQGRLRDDVTVLTGMVMRLEGTVQGLTVEVRGEHSRYERLAREVARLREPAPS